MRTATKNPGDVCMTALRHDSWRMNDLGRLLDAARDAAPGDRFEFRDAIAALGIPAIEPLRQWISDPRLGPFAVRALQKVGADPANRAAVLNALRSVDKDSLPEQVSTDVSQAITALGGEALRRTTPTKKATRSLV